MIDPNLNILPADLSPGSISPANGLGLGSSAGGEAGLFQQIIMALMSKAPETGMPAGEAQNQPQLSLGKDSDSAQGPGMLLPEQVPSDFLPVSPEALEQVESLLGQIAQDMQGIQQLLVSLGIEWKDLENSDVSQAVREFLTQIEEIFKQASAPTGETSLGQLLTGLGDPRREGELPQAPEVKADVLAERTAAALTQLKQDIRQLKESPLSDTTASNTVSKGPMEDPTLTAENSKVSFQEFRTQEIKGRKFNTPETVPQGKELVAGKTPPDFTAGPLVVQEKADSEESWATRAKVSKDPEFLDAKPISKTEAGDFVQKNSVSNIKAEENINVGASSLKLLDQILRAGEKGEIKDFSKLPQVMAQLSQGGEGMDREKAVKILEALGYTEKEIKAAVSSWENKHPLGTEKSPGESKNSQGTFALGSESAAKGAWLEESATGADKKNTARMFNHAGLGKEAGNTLAYSQLYIRGLGSQAGGEALTTEGKPTSESMLPQSPAGQNISREEASPDPVVILNSRGQRTLPGFYQSAQLNSAGLAGDIKGGKEGEGAEFSGRETGQENKKSEEGLFGNGRPVNIPETRWQMSEQGRIHLPGRAEREAGEKEAKGGKNLLGTQPGFSLENNEKVEGSQLQSKPLQTSGEILKTESSPTPYKTPTEEKEIVRQISRGFISIEKDGVKEIRLDLKPATLGRVLIAVEITKEALSGKITVENDAVRHVVENNLHTLREAVEHHNIKLSSLEVSVDHNRQFLAGRQNPEGAQGRSDGRQSHSQQRDRGREFARESSAARFGDTGRRMGYNSLELVA